MSPVDERGLDLLHTADLLEQWASDLPKRGTDSEEFWHEFVARRQEAEVALIERLHEMPGCRFESCRLRRKIRLTLAGITVYTDDGLGTALRQWARKARASR